MQRVYVKTMGCKVNTFDSQAIQQQFARSGAEIVADPTRCDVAVVNSCSVTANADKEARYFARRLRRVNPGAMVVFTGCYAQTDSATLAAMTEIDLVVPNEIKEQLVAATKETFLQLQMGEQPKRKVPGSTALVKNNRQGHFKAASAFFDQTFLDHTRAFLKIQDGCNGFCTYCLIPYARGASRSVPPEQVVAEVNRLVDKGVREIVLTGIHVGDYGRDLADCSSPYPVAGLIREILANPQLARLRISSLEPSEVKDELLQVVADNHHRVCAHWHLPLQSGCDTVLRRMRRSYTSAEYAKAVSRLRQVFPRANIGADVIPGFPGETEAEFDATLKFVAEMDLAYLHVFPYSSRPGTAANRMPGHLDPSLVKARSEILRDWSKVANRRYASQFLGQPLEVLWEHDCDNEKRRYGTTANYLKVVCGSLEQPTQGEITVSTPKGFIDKNLLLVI